MLRCATALVYTVLSFFPSIASAQARELDFQIPEKVLVWPEKETRMALGSQNVTRIRCPDGWIIKNISPGKPFFEVRTKGDRADIKFTELMVQEYPELTRMVTITCADELREGYTACYKLIVEANDVGPETIQLIEDASPIKKELLRCQETNQNLIKLVVLNVCMIGLLVYLLKRKNKTKA